LTIKGTTYRIKHNFMIMRVDDFIFKREYGWCEYSKLSHTKDTYERTP